LDSCGIKDFSTASHHISEIEKTYNISFVRAYSEYSPINFDKYNLFEKEALAIDISLETEGVGIMILVSE